MKQGAELFEGEHNFAKYCTRPSEKTNFVRTINFCKIDVNTKYQANFFPDQHYYKFKAFKTVCLYVCPIGILYLSTVI